MPELLAVNVTIIIQDNEGNAIRFRGDINKSNDSYATLSWGKDSADIKVNGSQWIKSAIAFDVCANASCILNGVVSVSYYAKGDKQNIQSLGEWVLDAEDCGVCIEIVSIEEYQSIMSGRN